MVFKKGLNKREPQAGRRLQSLGEISATRKLQKHAIFAPPRLKNSPSRERSPRVVCGKTRPCSLVKRLSSPRRSLPRCRCPATPSRTLSLSRLRANGFSLWGRIWGPSAGSSLQTTKAMWIAWELCRVESRPIFPCPRCVGWKRRSTPGRATFAPKAL